MNIETFVGMVAATCTTISFVPQIIKIYRSKHAKDLSLPMYIFFTFGVFMWLIYGVMLNSVPVITANGVTVIFCAYIIAMKLKYK